MLGHGPIGSVPLGAFDSLQDGALPVVVVKALVVLGEKTKEGHIIEGVAPAWQAIVKVLRSRPEDIFLLSPRALEELVAGAYEESGFDSVILTPWSGDLGRDIIAEKSGWGSVRIVDQVKAYKPGHVVTAEEVRALGFVALSDHRVTKGVVTTTSVFAPRITQDPLISQYLPTRIELIDGKQLIQRLTAIPTKGS